MIFFKLPAIILLVTPIFGTALSAQNSSGENQPAKAERLSEYRWQNRLLLLFSGDGSSEPYRNQLQSISAHLSGYRDRDMLVIHVNEVKEYELSEDEISLHRRAPKEIQIRWNKKFAVKDGQFMAILIGKDGTEKLRTDEVLPANKLFSVIDAMPMRQQEMKNNSKNRKGF